MQMNSFEKKYKEIKSLLNESYSDSRDDYDDAKFMANLNADRYLYKSNIDKKMKDKYGEKKQTVACKKCGKDFEISEPDWPQLGLSENKGAERDFFEWKGSLSKRAKKKLFGHICDDCFGNNDEHIPASYEDDSDPEL